MKRYGQLVYTICLRNCGNPFDAEDVMQETFLAVYKGLEEFDREREQAWICRIAVNKCLDFLKSAERRQVPVEEVFSDVEPAEAKEVPEQVYLKKESEEAVRVLCESLKEPYGSVAVAHFYEGKTAREISEVTGQGLKTVQTHIYRAKLMLKSKLERSRDDSYG
ncbi:MAG: RNA polymerase sigma factor [Lachnospiraceae bacterium]|nr:RNA polymerase sigma factor [Lachnospiraceae bacterium]MBR3762102.1 RNA polymerase sigma factor [Lachnospiraceae bacterium]